MATLNWMRACWECDGCGKDFVVEVDPGRSPPKEWDLIEIAKDAVRGGEIVPPKGARLIQGSSSVQRALVLCGDCTRIADAIGDENYKPTQQEILDATGGPALA